MCLPFGSTYQSYKIGSFRFWAECADIAVVSPVLVEQSTGPTFKFVGTISKG